MLQSLNQLFFVLRGLLLAGLLATAIWTTPASAWNSSGHKSTAKIAYGLLSEEQREFIGQVLRAHPRFQEDFAAQMPAAIATAEESVRTLWIFQQASVWPDILRNLDDTEQEKYGPANWHYINMPVYLEDRDEKEMQRHLRYNIETSFQPPLQKTFNIVQALKGNLHVWNDENSSDNEKAVALCWIIHLTGDIHQPLHAVSLFNQSVFPEGDRGGNSILIKSQADPTNLHAVWDNLPDRIEDFVPGDLTRDILRTDAVTSAAIDYWLMRHIQLARALVYSPEIRKQLLAGKAQSDLPQLELSEFYRANNALVAKEQIILAGHRIASLLE